VTGREEIWQAARDGDADKIGRMARALDWGQGGRIPDSTIQVLIDALLDVAFVSSPVSHVLVEVFEQDGLGLGLHAKHVSPEQHARLMAAFEAAMPVASIQLSFEISVLLGEHFHDAGALGVLTRLRTASNPRVRQDVVHALEHFTIAFEDVALRRRAHALLRDMADDPDAQTRASVASSLEYVERSHEF
jgi:hypothetical protein